MRGNGHGRCEAEPISWPKETQCPRVLIVTPAYNEELKVGGVVRSLRQLVPGADVLVVNDGSKDDTACLAREAGAMVVSHPYNLGYGAACQTGFKYAWRYEYDYIVQMDSDGQHEPRSVIDLLAAIMEPDADVVLGSRWLGLVEYHGPLIRKIGKSLFGSIANLVTGLKVTDPTTGFQALTRQVVGFYCSDVYPVDFPDADVIIMLKRAGFRVKEAPVIMYRNETGQSMHAGLIRPLYYGMKMMLSIAMTLLRDDRKLCPKRPVRLGTAGVHSTTQI